MNETKLLELSQLLMRLKMLAVTQFARPMRETYQNSLPSGYHNILICLMERRLAGIATSMTDLAKETMISKPNLTPVVNRLCEEGMVERVSDPKDRRVMVLSITEQGIEFLKSQRKQTMEFLKGKLSLLEEQDLLKMQRALEDLTQVLMLLKEKEQTGDKDLKEESR